MSIARRYLSFLKKEINSEIFEITSLMLELLSGRYDKEY
jgi:hypothetical protein